MIPRIVIAGTHSGCGKTTIASGLMAALIKRGMTVQPFKVGPDFIDPSHHSAICKRPSRNLDPYMMGEEGVLETFTRASEGADIAVIEGVMGLYDGLEGVDCGSTAHVAKILHAPVILTVNVKGMSRSANATVQGYRHFDEEVCLAGVIFNQVGSPRHRQMIESSLKTTAFGWIPYKRDNSVESRHLGLCMAHETNTMAAFGPVIEEYCDIDAILDAAAKGRDSPVSYEVSKGTNPDDTATIAVAFDQAFCFYYQDNLDRLREQGANLIFFSPLHDALPDADALYLGGGYPELYASELQTAQATGQIRGEALNGMPLYAECGGLTYLTRDITIGSDTKKMVGVLPAHTVKMDRFQALGYVHAHCSAGDALLPRGLTWRGHEFHYTGVECDSDARFAISLTRGRGICDGKDGIYEGRILAGYTHAYFSNRFAESLVNVGKRYNKER